jgi:hypothetical protein
MVPFTGTSSEALMASQKTGAPAPAVKPTAAPTAAPPAAPPVAPASYGGEARPDRNVAALPAALPRKTGIDALVANKDKKAAATPAAVTPTIAAAEGEPPTLTPSAVAKTMSAAEKKAEAKALAKGDDEAYDAIHAKATARAEKRRAELDAETTPTKGLLGLSMSPETRKLLRDAGVGMMTSKSTNALGGIGEGLQKAATEYDAGKTRRAERADLLDAADDKRAAAQLAARQGNMNAARQFQADADKAQQDAEGIALKKDEGNVARYAAQNLRAYQQGSLAQGIAQLASQEKIAAMRGSRENLGSPQMQLINAMMAANPKMTMQQAIQATKESLTPKDVTKMYEQLLTTNTLTGEKTPPFAQYYKQIVTDLDAGSGNVPTNFTNVPVGARMRN